MKGCFVCPIYDKENDFEFGYVMAESAKKNGIIKDLFFVFSSYDQQDKFLQTCRQRFDAVPGSMVLDSQLPNCKNPVTIKKFYGLYKLMDQYEYIATIDCESVFISDIPVGKVLDRVWQERSFLASNISSQGAAVVKKCAEAMGLVDNEVLISETGNFKYTWWFNDIPVYRTKDIREFFEWIKNDKKIDIIYNEFCCFDYLVYVIWLLLYKDGFHLKKYKVRDYVSIIESLWRPEKIGKVRIEKQLGTHWTSRVDLKTEVNPKIYMQFHCDRRHKKFKNYFGRLYACMFRRSAPRR